MKYYLYLCFFLAMPFTQAQDITAPDPSDEQAVQLPYHVIPEYPKSYNACTVTARMIDGLGFRYYWATEGLRKEDLEYQPTESARTVNETIEHLYQLSMVILRCVRQEPNIRPSVTLDISFAEKRTKTLFALREASDILRGSKEEDMEKFNIVFQRGDTSSEFPFWHQINGPIADALWHCGQVVSFRRASGNPFNSKVNVFMGSVKE